MPLMNMVQAINLALREEMARDDRVVILGEDVGKDGGVFRVAEGLLEPSVRSGSSTPPSPSRPLPGAPSAWPPTG